MYGENLRTIALFGGTFDPPHIGHVEVVLSVVEQQYADEVWVVPVRQNPLKALKASNPSIRKKMVEATFGALPCTRIIYDELESQSQVYTIDTIRHLKRKYTYLAESQVLFVIGSDAFLEKNQWKEIEELEKEVTFLVVKRQGVDLVPSVSAKPFFMPRMDVSSTDVRDRVCKGRYIAHLVHKEVEQIINANQLYV